jgi:hypothetical protein
MAMSHIHPGARSIAAIEQDHHEGTHEEMAALST